MSEIWVSDKLINIADIYDCMGNSIFAYVNEDMIGCLIFCDINTYANWQHDCKYIFIAESGKMITKLHTMPPNENIHMHKVSKHGG